MTLSRQKTPHVRTSGGDLSAKGAYELLAAEGGEAQVTIFASGTEVGVAVAARDILQAKGKPTRVVSTPCWELFEQQDAAYKASVIGQAPVRVAVEAAIRMSPASPGRRAPAAPSPRYARRTSNCASSPVRARRSRRAPSWRPW